MRFGLVKALACHGFGCRVQDFKVQGVGFSTDGPGLRVLAFRVLNFRLLGLGINSALGFEFRV